MQQEEHQEQFLKWHIIMWLTSGSDLITAKFQLYLEIQISTSEMDTKL